MDDLSHTAFRLPHGGHTEIEGLWKDPVNLCKVPAYDTVKVHLQNIGAFKLDPRSKGESKREMCAKPVMCKELMTLQTQVYNQATG